MILLHCLAATLLVADVPEISLFHPNGASVGETVQVRVSGKNLTDQTRFVCPELAIDTRMTDAKAGTFEIAIPGDAAVGVYPVWIVNDSGPSPATPFMIDSLPQQTLPAKAEPLRTEVTVPSVVAGVLRGNLIHELRFEGRAGQPLAIDVWADRIGSYLDPRIVLLGPNGRVLEEIDDVEGLGCDCRLFVTLPEDGEYVVQIHDSTYSMNETQPYRLRLGGGFPEYVFPLGAQVGMETAFELGGGTLKKPMTITAALEPSTFHGLSLLAESDMLCAVAASDFSSRVVGDAEGDHECHPPVIIDGVLEGDKSQAAFIIKAKPGAKLHCRVEAAALGSKLDAILTAKAGNKQLARQDAVFHPELTVRNQDVGYSTLDPIATFDAPKDGDVRLELTDRLLRGGSGYEYRLHILDAASAFELSVNVSAWSAAAGQAVEMPVKIERHGFAGAIRLQAEGLPDGWECPPVTSKGKEDEATLTLAIPESPGTTATMFRIVGHADGMENGAPVVARHLATFAAERFRRRERLPRMIPMERFAVIVGDPQPDSE